MEFETWYMEMDWDFLDEFPCHDHQVFFIDLIVEEIVKILPPGDLLHCRLLTVTFSYCAARWIKKKGWFVINFKYSYQIAKYVCTKRLRNIGGLADLDPDLDREINQLLGLPCRQGDYPNQNQNQNTLAKLSDTIRNSNNFPFTNIYFTTEMPQSLDLTNFAAVHGKDDQEILNGGNATISAHGPSRKPRDIAGTKPSPSPKCSSSSSSSSSSKGKKINMTCGVCGDHSKSHHFGGVSCDSCKAFFRRSVISNTYPHFSCVQQHDKCLITLGTRRLCQYCRFAKCGLIGMDKKWVLGDDERRAFQKLRQQKKKAKKSNLGTWKNDPAIILEYMSPSEQLNVEQLVLYSYESRVTFPHKVIPSSGYSPKKNQSNKKSSIEIVGMFRTLLRRHVFYLRKLAYFTELTHSDQKRLLYHGFLEICQLSSALSFNDNDGIKTRWPYNKNEHVAGPQNHNSPPFHLCGEYLKNLVQPENSLHEMQRNFKRGLQRLEADEVVILLLNIIVVFGSEREELKEPTRVAQAQEFYSELLRKYVRWRYEPHGSLMFPKFLAKLTQLRQLTDALQDFIGRRAWEEKYNIRKLVDERRALTEGFLVIEEMYHATVGPEVSGSGTEPGEERCATETTDPTTEPTSHNMQHATKPPPLTSLMFYNMINQEIHLLFQDLTAQVSESDEAVAKKIIEQVLLREIQSVTTEETFSNSSNPFNKDVDNLPPVVGGICKTNFSAYQDDLKNRGGDIGGTEARYWLDWWWAESDVTPECDDYCIPVKGLDQAAQKEGTAPLAVCALYQYNKAGNGNGEAQVRDTVEETIIQHIRGQ